MIENRGVPYAPRAETEPRRPDRQGPDPESLTRTLTADTLPIFDQRILGRCPMGRLAERAARHSLGNVP